MLVIGLRCWKDSFSYVVLTGTQQSPNVVEKACCDFPANETWCGKLHWLREEIHEILERHPVDSAVVKVCEPNARSETLRTEAEGVAKEAVYSKQNVDCEKRTKRQIRSRISGFDRAARYVLNALDAHGLQALNNSSFKEAAVAALAELPTEE